MPHCKHWWVKQHVLSVQGYCHQSFWSRTTNNIYVVSETNSNYFISLQLKTIGARLLEFGLFQHCCFRVRVRQRRAGVAQFTLLQNNPPSISLFLPHLTQYVFALHKYQCCVIAMVTGLVLLLTGLHAGWARFLIIFTLWILSGTQLRLQHFTLTGERKYLGEIGGVTLLTGRWSKHLRFIGLGQRT